MVGTVSNFFHKEAKLGRHQNLPPMKKIWETDKPIFIKCDCHSFEFFEIGWFHDEPKIFYICVSCNPKDWKEKLKGIWRIIKGSDYGITDEVLINRNEAKKLLEWLQKRI